MTNSSLYNKQGFWVFVQCIPPCWWKLPNEPPWRSGVTHPEEVRADLRDARMSGSFQRRFCTSPAAGARAGPAQAAVPGWEQAGQPTFSCPRRSLHHTQRALFSELDVAGPLKSDLGLVIINPPGAVWAVSSPAAFGPAAGRGGCVSTAKPMAAGV